MTYNLVYLALLFAGCGYAAIRGGAPERWGAAAVIGGMLLSNIAMLLSGRGFTTAETGLMMVDTLEGGALLVLALKANRFWPLWVAMVQIDAVLIHIVMFSQATPPFSYGFALHAFSLPLPALVGLGAIRHRQRLRQLGADPAWS